MPTVLITGADRGLGQALVRCFSSQGWRVFAGYLDTASAESLASVTVLPMDVRSDTQVRAAAAAVAGATDALDLIVNNAGIYPARAELPIEEVDIDAAVLAFDVNALGPLRVTKHFIGLLRKGTRPALINISSEAGGVTTCWRKDTIPYCMSKGALNVQTRILDLALRDEVRVLAIHPGWMQTPMGTSTGGKPPTDPNDTARGVLRFYEEGWEGHATIFRDYTGAEIGW